MANKMLCAELPAEISLCPPVHALQWKLNRHFLLSPGCISISFFIQKKITELHVQQGAEN